MAAIHILRIGQVSVLQLHPPPFESARALSLRAPEHTKRTSPCLAVSVSPSASIPTYSKRAAGQRNAARWSSVNRRRFISYPTTVMRAGQRPVYSWKRAREKSRFWYESSACSSVVARTRFGAAFADVGRRSETSARRMYDSASVVVEDGRVWPLGPREVACEGAVGNVRYRGGPTR